MGNEKSFFLSSKVISFPSIEAGEQTSVKKLLLSLYISYPNSENYKASSNLIKSVSIIADEIDILVPSHATK